MNTAQYMRVAVLGRTKILYDTIDALRQAGYQIVLIGTCAEGPEYDVKARDFEIIAQKLGVPFFCNSRLDEFEILSILKKANADIAVSVNWLNIIGENVIQCFKHGILNAHAGDLPRYRGNACPNWAILMGESRIGVSVHFMEPGKLDSGDILLKHYHAIDKNTRISDIYGWLNEKVPDMFVEAIGGLANRTLVAKKQSKNSADILRVYPRKPVDSLISWSWSAAQIERVINASSEPLSGAYTFYNMKKLIIWEAYSTDWEVPSIAVPGQVVKRDQVTGEVSIACGEGVLSLIVVQIEGSKRDHPTAIIKSMRDRLGMHIEDEIYNLYKMLPKL